MVMGTSRSPGGRGSGPGLAPGAEPDHGCTVLHVDMDAFYAAVSLIDMPHLATQPVVIGGGWRSVVLSANYPAREYGIRSGIPMSRARRLCPQVVILPPDYERYSRVSDAVMDILGSVTAVLQPVSMEEAFLDVSAARRQGSPTVLAQWIRDTIADELAITCSVGGAPTTMVAKMASKAAKPDGIRMVPPEQVLTFLHPLPVGALWGVGESTESGLTRLGLRTVADLAHLPVQTLRRAFGAGTADHLHAMAWGGRDATVTPPPVERSIGHSETFDHDIDDPVLLHRQLLALSDRVAARMRHAGLMGRTVTLTVRFSDFTTITRTATVADATDVGREIHAIARSLFDRLGLQRARIRLLGVRVERLTAVSQTMVQGRLDEPERGWREAERAVDRISARFGTATVLPASLVRDETRPGRHPGHAPERGFAGIRLQRRSPGTAADPSVPGPGS